MFSLPSAYADTFTSDNPTVDGFFRDDITKPSPGSPLRDCSTGDIIKMTAGGSLAVQQRGFGGYDCSVVFLEYDISSIPVGSIVTDVTFTFEVIEISSPADKAIDCVFKPIETAQPSVSSDNGTRFDLISGGITTDVYVISSLCKTTGGNKVVDLGTQADSDVQSTLANATKDYFAFGIIPSTFPIIPVDLRRAEIASEDNPSPTPSPTLEITFTVLTLDADGDGIFDNVDTLPLVFSDDFNDFGLGGTSFGTIVSRAGLTVTVTDALLPADGLIVTATGAGGNAIIRECGGGAIVKIPAGSSHIVTCTSITIQVLSGTIFAEFLPDDVIGVTLDIVEDHSISFDPETLVFTTPITNPDTLVIVVNGEGRLLNPGDTLIISTEDFVDGVIDEVIELVDEAEINAGHGNSLNSKLEGAIDKIADGKNTAAINKLNAFINQVNAFVQSGKLSAEDGQILTDAAESIIDSL